MIDIKINERDKSIISIWHEMFTAFNTITFNGKKYIIAGGDYDGDITFDTYDGLIGFIEQEVKEALLFYVLEKDVNTIIGIINEF